MSNKKWDKLVLDYDKHCQMVAQATIIKLSESAADRIKRMRKLESNYSDWFEYYFPNYAKKKCAWFHLKLANLIIKNKRIRALAEWFRSAAKSVHIDMGIPLFLYLVLNDLKFMLLIGETDPKAKKLLSGIQVQLQYNKRIINDYGEKFQFGDWSEGDFVTSDGVRFMSLGFGQSPRGAREGAQRPDYIAMDDVDSRRHVNNDRLMRDGVEYITEDVWGCFDSDEDGTERFVYANNNFNKNSITNRLKQYFVETKARIKQTGDTNIFHVITVNAVKNLQTFEPEWKEKTSAEYWRKKYNSMPRRAFMREFMNTHVADGKIFKHEDIVRGKMLSLDKYEALVFYGDLSYKAQGDLKAMWLVGKIKRELHIIYGYLRRKSRADCAEWLYDIYEDKRLSRFPIHYIIEGLFAMDEFVNDFDIEGDKRGFYVPVVANKSPKSNKHDRIEGLAGFFERHNIIFNEAEVNTPDFVTLIDQFLDFEKGSKTNDDGPDSIEGGVAELFKITRIDQFPVATTSRASIISKSHNRY